MERPSSSPGASRSRTIRPGGCRRRAGLLSRRRSSPWRCSRAAGGGRCGAWPPSGGRGAVVIGWSVEKVLIESLGLTGWAMSLVMAALALLCPLAGAAAVARGSDVPAFAAVLSGAPRPADRLATLLGGLALALCVI